tara:strand:- start:3879 stop:5561 length:1683 start_codon:yes stop_codon:yes gene_type:complete
MARQEIENSILKSLQDDWSDLNQFEQGSDRFFEDFDIDGKKVRDDYARQDFDKLPEREKAIRREREDRVVLGQDLNKAQQERKQEQLDKLNSRQKFGYGLSNALGEGKIDHQKAYWNARAAQDLDIEAPKLQQIFGTNATTTRIRDLIHESKGLPQWAREWGGSNPADYKARVDAGLGLEKDGYARSGQVLGTALSDINQDRLRNFWWLMNAPQAVTNVVQELGLSRAAPDLYSADKVTDDKGFELTLDKNNYGELAKRDLISFDPEGNPVLRSGVQRVAASDSGNSGKIALSKRRYRPGMVDALQLPSALAINAGVGLLNPLGGSNGYSAVFESDDDPTKSDNIVGEVAAKYILGRTGNLLNWDEFKKVRPDVSKDEYMRYKAFKYDKEGDWNPLDGDFTVPTGILKGTSEGIHGPEIQFLGRSIPLITTMLPVAAAGVGTALGARWQPEKFNEWTKEKEQMQRMQKDQTSAINKLQLSPEVRDTKIREMNNELKEAKRKVWLSKGKEYQKEYLGINRVRNGIAAGLASYAGALGTGLLLENERRRRNQAENESNQTQP